MHWLAGFALGTVTVIGSIVVANAIATRAGYRPVGLWGSVQA